MTLLGLFVVAAARDNLTDALQTEAAVLQWCDEPERDKRKRK